MISLPVEIKIQTSNTWPRPSTFNFYYGCIIIHKYTCTLYLIGHFALVGVVVVEDCVRIAVLDTGYQPGKVGHEVAK